MHEELERINCENRAKIKRLESQQIRYEKDIKYLNDVIEKYELQKKSDKETICDLKSQLSEALKRLKHNEQICDQKEKFILFQESQLLESEDVIYNLKQRITQLVSERLKEEEMADTHVDPPDNLIDLDNQGILNLVARGSQYLFDRIDHLVHTPGLRKTCDQWREMINIGVHTIHNRLVSDLHDKEQSWQVMKDEYDVMSKICDENVNKNKTLQGKCDYLNNKCHKLEESFNGLKLELQFSNDDYEKLEKKKKGLELAYKNKIDELEDVIVRKDRRIDYWKQRFDNCENRRRILTIEVQTLHNEIQRLQSDNRRLSTERNILRNRIENTHNENQGLYTEMRALRTQNQELRNQNQVLRTQIQTLQTNILTFQTNNRTLTDERDDLQHQVRVEQFINRRLAKQIAALRILVRQLQIRNMNPPINIPPIIINPQPNIIWLPLR